MTIHEVKQWVVQNAKVNKPYNKNWNAYTTLGGLDINEMATTIEKAYDRLAFRIRTSKFLLNALISKQKT